MRGAVTALEGLLIDAGAARTCVKQCYADVQRKGAFWLRPAEAAG